MINIKTKATGIILSLTLLIGMLPVQAASQTEYVTREEAVVGLLDTIGYGALNETKSDLSIFSDAKSINSQDVDELSIAMSNGILIWTSDKKLDLMKNITRQDFAAIISHTMRDLPNIKTSIPFSDVPAEHLDEVEKLVQAGLFSGYGNGKFGPDDYLTKAQLSSVLNNISHLSSVRPQDDFYYAVNQNWLSTAKLPAGSSSLLSFTEVTRANNSNMKAMVKDLINNSANWKEGTKEQKISDFYSTIVDKQNRNKQGIEPIRQYLDKLDGVKNVQELLDVSALFENDLGLNPLFSFDPSADLKDSNHYSLYGSGLSITLPSDYMLKDDPQIKGLYEKLISQILKLSGFTDENASKSAKEIYDFEKLIAGSTLSNEKASRVENIYNPVKVDDLAAMFTGADIKSYLTKLGYGSVEKLVVTDTGLMKKTGELISDKNLEILKAYARFHFVLKTSPYLSEDLANSIISFNSAFMGVTGSLSEEDRAFNCLSTMMDEYMGEMYVGKYFSQEAKKDVQGIVNQIIATYEKRIQNLDWMTNDTKAAAISKLKAIKLKVGYPDTWEDPLEGISIKSYKDGGSLLGNIFAASSTMTKKSKALLSKPVDKSEWEIPPQTVNAYYNPSNNEIVIPAGILQPPFYDVNASRESNLGGIGCVIAHEITHAFDNNGAQFDKNGNMTNWWTEKDYSTFKQKCQDVINLYNGLKIAPNAEVNGNLTLSENVADIGGMACILDIAKGLKDTNYKELFESNARVWHMTATNQAYQMLTTQDVHAPNKLRVNQVLRNFKEFYDTYGVKPGDAMYLAPENRVIIW